MESLDAKILFVLCTSELGAEDLLGHAALPSQLDEGKRVNGTTQRRKT
jgi:hypothetical protein